MQVLFVMESKVALFFHGCGTHLAVTKVPEYQIIEHRRTLDEVQRGNITSTQPTTAEDIHNATSVTPTASSKGDESIRSDQGRCMVFVPNLFLSGMVVRDLGRPETWGCDFNEDFEGIRFNRPGRGRRSIESL